MIAYGALIVVGAWLAGKTAPAREIRRALTPGLTRRAWGYPALVVIVLIFFWLGPTSGTSRLLPSLVLIALFIGGFEGLRYQAMRDFPEETPERAMEEWKARWERVRDWVRDRWIRRKAPDAARRRSPPMPGWRPWSGWGACASPACWTRTSSTGKRNASSRHSAVPRRAGAVFSGEGDRGNRDGR